MGRFAQLSARDRRALISAAIVVVLAAGYVFALEPYLAYRERLNVSVAAARDTLNFVEQTARSIQRMRSADAGRANGRDQIRSLLSRIDAGARELRLNPSLKRMEPTGGKVRVWVENARFDDLLRLFGNLRSKSGVEVSELRLRRGKISGFADGRIVFSDAGLN